MCFVAGTEASNYSSYRASLLKLSTGQNWRKYAYYSGISEVLFLSSSSQDLVVEQTVLLVFLLLSSCCALLPCRSCLFSSHNVCWVRIMLRYCSSFRSFTLQCIVSKPLAAVPALLVVCTHHWDLGSSFYQESVKEPFVLSESRPANYLTHLLENYTWKKNSICSTLVSL